MKASELDHAPLVVEVVSRTRVKLSAGGIELLDYKGPGGCPEPILVRMAIAALKRAHPELVVHRRPEGSYPADSYRHGLGAAGDN